MSQSISVELKLKYMNSTVPGSMTFSDLPQSILPDLKSNIQTYNSSNRTDNDKSVIVNDEFDYTGQPGNMTITAGGLESISGARIIVVEETDIEPT